MKCKRVLVVFPTSWDRRQLEACRPVWEGRYELLFTEPTDEDCAWDFDILGFIDRTVAQFGGAIDGVFSSSDYPGATVAGAIATRLGLPGTPPERIIGCSHKYYSRVFQRDAVPEATPWFAIVDPRDPMPNLNALQFPCFIKPVKGAFSVLSQRLNTPDELRAFCARPRVQEFVHDYVHMFNRLVAHFTTFEVNGSYFIAEELLRGGQVTVEGFATADAVEILGIVDSATFPGGSFARFDYPSAVEPTVQRRMADIAARVVRHMGLRYTLFNIEMIYDARYDRISIIEINPRMCGQFGDLYGKVDGTSGYEIALALATGQVPSVRHGAGPYRTAASFPLRTFSPVRVLSAPTAERVAAAQALYPQTLVWLECADGQTLADFEGEDGQSSRYAIVNLGGDTRAELAARLEVVRQALQFRFAPT